MLTERAVGVEVGGDREVGGAGQNLKKKKKKNGERGVSNIWEVFTKYGC